MCAFFIPVHLWVKGSFYSQMQRNEKNKWFTAYWKLQVIYIAVVFWARFMLKRSISKQCFWRKPIIFTGVIWTNNQNGVNVNSGDLPCQNFWFCAREILNRTREKIPKSLREKSGLGVKISKKVPVKRVLHPWKKIKKMAKNTFHGHFWFSPGKKHCRRCEP